MDSKVISAITDNLKVINTLLKQLSSEQFNNNSIGPYYSSIGSHLRHIMDVFNCTSDGLDSGHVNLISRDRNELVETIPEVANEYLDKILNFIYSLKDIESDKIVQVTDDLGNGKTTLPYTIAGLLAQANSHTIHHFACIGYILEQLDISIPGSRFGYNPTTPKKENI